MHHGRGLRRLWKDDALLEAVLDDWETAPLDPRRRALVDYAAKLTRTPSEVERADLEALRAQGLGDADLLGLVEVIGYYAYVNRLVDGLGVELEPWGDDHSPA